MANKNNKSLTKKTAKHIEDAVVAVTIDDVQDKIVVMRGEPVVIDSDVAALYGVETKDINRAVKNNLRKFPSGYIIALDETEKDELVKNFHRFNMLKHSTVPPKAFTERGLYMLATILKSRQAEQTTLATSSKIKLKKCI